MRSAWSVDIHECAMFEVVRKLKLMNNILKKLNSEGFTQIHVSEAKALQGPKVVQEALHQNPTNVFTGEKEMKANEDNKCMKDIIQS